MESRGSAAVTLRDRPQALVKDFVKYSTKEAKAEWRPSGGALFLPATHEIINGPVGVGTFFAGLIDSGVTGHKLELIEATDSTDLIVAAAKWTAHGKGSSGAPAAFSGIAMHVFAKQGDGSLKLKLHTFN